MSSYKPPLPKSTLPHGNQNHAPLPALHSSRYGKVSKKRTYDIHRSSLEMQMVTVLPLSTAIGDTLAAKLSHGKQCQFSSLME
jgi:hypothetical protein